MSKIPACGRELPKSDFSPLKKQCKECIKAYNDSKSANSSVEKEEKVSAKPKTSLPKLNAKVEVEEDLSGAEETKGPEKKDSSSSDETSILKHKIVDLTNSLDTVKNEFESFVEESNAKEIELKLLYATNECENEKKLEEANSEIACLKEEFDEQSSLVETRDEHIRELVNGNKGGFDAKIAEKDEEIERLTSELAKQTSIAQSSNNSTESESILAMKKELDENKEYIAELEEQLTEFTETTKLSKIPEETTSTEVSDLVEENKVLLVNIKDFENELVESKKETAEYVLEIGELRTDLENVREQSVEAESKIASLERDLSDTKSELSSATCLESGESEKPELSDEERYTQIIKDYGTLVKEGMEARNCFDETKYNSIMAKHSEYVKVGLGIESELSDESKRLKETQEFLQASNNEIMDLEEVKVAYEKEIVSFEKTVKSLTDDVDHLHEYLSSSSEKIVALENKLILVDEVPKLQSSAEVVNEELLNTYATLEGDYETLQKSYTELLDERSSSDICPKIDNTELFDELIKKVAEMSVMEEVIANPLTFPCRLITFLISKKA